MLWGGLSGECRLSGECQRSLDLHKKQAPAVQLPKCPGKLRVDYRGKHNAHLQSPWKCIDFGTHHSTMGIFSPSFPKNSTRSGLAWCYPQGSPNADEYDEYRPKGSRSVSVNPPNKFLHWNSELQQRPHGFRSPLNDPLECIVKRSSSLIFQIICG